MKSVLITETAPGTNADDRRNRAGCDAFTLVEVMMASMVAAIVFAALFYGVTQGFRLVENAREGLRATQIIVGKAEGLRLCAWGNGTNQPSQLFNITNVPTTFTDTYYPVGLSGSTNTGVIYSGTIQITTNFPFSGTVPSYSNAMAQAIITVTWQDIHDGRTNTFLRSMKTYVSQYGVQNYIYTH